MTTMERLKTEFLELPREERAVLARELIVSLDSDLDNDTTSLDPDVANAWAQVAVERSHAYDAGETTARDWREVVERIEKKLDERGGREART